jgi:hypothetical protein
MPGSPWENGYCESFNSKLRDELLNREITPKEAKIIIETGDSTIISWGPTPRWAISHRHPKLRSGLAKMDPRQRWPWPAGQACTSILNGSPRGGRPINKDMTTPTSHTVLTKLVVVILASDTGIDQCFKRRDCRISNWPNCRFTK